MTTLQEKMKATLEAKKAAATSSAETAALDTTAGTDTSGTTQEGATTTEVAVSQPVPEVSVDPALSGTIDMLAEVEYEMVAPVSLPDDVLAQIMAKQEYAGLAVGKGANASETIEGLMLQRSAVLEGAAEMPLEAIDRAIQEIQSNSDSLLYEKQLRIEQEEHEKLVAAQDAAVMEIALAGGDIAYTPSPITSIGRGVGDYSYVESEVDTSSELLTAPVPSPLWVYTRTNVFLKDVRQLLASHNVNIARMNPFAGAQINDTVKNLDQHIFLLTKAIKLAQDLADHEDAVGYKEE